MRPERSRSRDTNTMRCAAISPVRCCHSEGRGNMNIYRYIVEGLWRGLRLLRSSKTGLTVARRDLPARPDAYDPVQRAGPRRWPVRRSDLEVFLAADTANDQTTSGRREPDRDSSG